MRDAITLIVLVLAEFFGLVVWLHFADQGSHVLGFICLSLGLFIERMTVFISSIYRPNDPQRTTLAQASRRFAIQAVRESFIWVIWLLVADGVSGLLAVGVLFVLMLLEHSADVAEQNGTHPLYYTRHPVALIYTIVEAVGAGLWLHYVRTGQPTLGIMILLVAMVIEHIMQGRIIDLEGPGSWQTPKSA